MDTYKASVNTGNPTEDNAEVNQENWTKDRSVMIKRNLREDFQQSRMESGCKTAEFCFSCTLGIFTRL